MRCERQLAPEMPSIRSRTSDLNANALVAAAESGQLACLQQLLLDIDPDSQTVVYLLYNISSFL